MWLYKDLGLNREIEKGLNKKDTIIYKIMSKEIGMSLFIVGGLSAFIIILFLLFLAIGVTYEREVMLVKISDLRFENIAVGYQRVNLKSALFEDFPKGDLRLYVEVKNLENDETVYTYLNQNVGNGSITISNIDLPEQNAEWYFRFELKNKDLKVLDSRCDLAKFYVENGNKRIERKEVDCK